MKELIRKIWKWTRTDGLLHIETSALILLIAHIIFPLMISVVLTACMGIVKEVIDKTTGKGTAEVHDLWCDLAGIILGVLLAVL